MPKNVDISSMALSRAEQRRLRRMRRDQPVADKLIDADPMVGQLFRWGLIERTYSEKYPYTPPSSGVIEIPQNALRLTDAGYQYLNQCEKEALARRHNWAVAIASALIGAVAGGLIGFVSAKLTLIAGL